MAPLSLRLAGVVGAKTYVWSSLFEWMLLMTMTMNPGCCDFEPSFL